MVAPNYPVFPEGSLSEIVTRAVHNARRMPLGYPKLQPSQKPSGRMVDNTATKRKRSNRNDLEATFTFRFCAQLPLIWYTRARVNPVTAITSATVAPPVSTLRMS